MIAHPESTYCYNLAATSSAARDQWVEALREAAQPRNTPSISISDGPGGGGGGGATLPPDLVGSGHAEYRSRKGEYPDIPAEYADKVIFFYISP